MANGATVFIIVQTILAITMKTVIENIVLIISVLFT